MKKSSAYPALDGLFDLACRDGVDIRPTLLRVLTDLYVQKRTHSAEEETQYVELALGLLEAVDAATRAAVAASLESYPAVPPAIRHKLSAENSLFISDNSGATEAHTDDVVEVFFAAVSEERRLLLATLDAGLPATARRRASTSSEVIRRLETAALQHNAGEIGRILERALGISRRLAERIARDPSGEPIIIAAKSLGMTAAVLQRVLLFLNPDIGQSVERVHDLSRFFDDLAQESADRMLALWQQTGRSAAPVHEAVNWDDERYGARSQLSPTERRSVRGRDEQPSRFRTGRR
jgi:hypothetical protein